MPLISSSGSERDAVNKQHSGEPASRTEKTRRLVLTALLFAVALVLAIVENALPPLPVPVPGVKFGLSNIAVMYALFFLSRGRAYMIALLKALFVFSTRGLVAGLLSLTGGFLSISAMLLIFFLFKDKISYMVVSVLGAVFHNIGQFAVVSLIYTNLYLWAYLPVLVISGVIAGIMTAVLLRAIMPALKKLA
jgi:heptaprenyl diphosphate synthase